MRVNWKLIHKHRHDYAGNCVYCGGCCDCDAAIAEREKVIEFLEILDSKMVRHYWDYVKQYRYYVLRFYDEGFNFNFNFNRSVKK